MKKTIIACAALSLLLPALALAKSAPRDTTPPQATAIHIDSTNANPSRAKAGDTVKLTFTASEKVTPIVLVETKTLFVKAKNTSGNSWDATYVVNAKDPTGKVDYLLTLIDEAGNVSICASFKLLLIKYCPSTDGSSVTVYKETTPPPVPDTVPPVISGHFDISVTTQGQSAAVNYALPTAVDDRDGSVAVSCTPAPGSAFALGTTTVTCSAHDAANNAASITFGIGVTQEVITPPEPPHPYTMASQPEEGFLCEGSWRLCFTPDVNTSTATIDLGAGSNMGTGGLQTVIITKDENDPNTQVQAWLISIQCFTAANYTGACSDWVAPTAANGNRTDLVKEFASQTADSKHWTASFTNASRNKNFDGSAPVTFNPAYYYQLIIDDQDWDVGAYGTETEPYWLIEGITQ